MLVKAPVILLGVFLINCVLVFSQVPPNKVSNVQEVINFESKCYTHTDLTRMLREILIFLQQNPYKINELHHLIDFLNTKGEANSIQEVVQEMVNNSGVSEVTKDTLRSKDNFSSRPGIKTKITFKYEVPSLDQPQCKDVFKSLMEIAHDAYMKLVKYPMCHPNPDERNYDDKSNNASPFNQGIQGLFKPNPYSDMNNQKYFSDRVNNPYIPENPYDIEDFLKLLPKENNQFDWLNPYNPDTIQNTFKEPVYNDYLKPVYDVPNKKKLNDLVLEQYILPSGVKDVTPRDKKEFNYRNPDGVIPPFNEYGSMNPQTIAYLLSLLENKGNIPQDPTQVINPEKVDNQEIIKYLLPMIMQHKHTDPKIINILITLLADNPKLKERILSLLRLNNNDDSNVDDTSENKYQILYSLLKPDENGFIDPKLIEIIKFLSKLNESSSPDYKIVQLLIPFLKPNANNIVDPKNIDMLLQLLRMNKDRKLPDEVYYKIILLLTQTTDKNRDINYFNNPMQDQENSPNPVDNLLPLLLANNPSMLSKLLPNQPIGIANLNTQNNNGVVEFTYLLKRPQPLIYHPYYYVKYRLPLSTFVSNVRQLLIQNPELSSNTAKLYQELIKISNVTDVSPKLQEYSKNEIVKLTFKDGTLVAAKLVNDEDKNVKDEIKMIQDLNSDVLPEEILEQANKVQNKKDSQVVQTKVTPFVGNFKDVAKSPVTPLISAEKKINSFVYNQPSGVSSSGLSGTQWSYGQNGFYPSNPFINSRFQVPNYKFMGPYYNYQVPRYQFSDSRLPYQHPGLRYRNPGF